MSLNGGDSLARGGRSAQFSSGGLSKTQVQWDLATLSESEFLGKYPGTTQARYQEMIAEQNQGSA